MLQLLVGMLQVDWRLFQVLLRAASHLQLLPQHLDCLVLLPLVLAQFFHLFLKPFDLCFEVLLTTPSHSLRLASPGLFG